MNEKQLVFLFFLILTVVLCFGCKKQPALDTYAEVLEAFKSPPAEFRSAPLWVWNDRVTEEQIETQLSDFKAHGIGGVFIHPRPGLITPYLSEEWLSLCRHAVDVGKKLGMKVWIYDENSYPSGFAGGHVPAQMPDAARTGLRMRRAAELPETFESPPVLILRLTPAGFEDITQQVNQKALGHGDYFIFDLIRSEPSPWYGGFTYVDLMRRDVTEKFLDVTLNAYKKVIGAEFGAAVPGVFQDEAEIAPPWGNDIVNYTPALFDSFQARWGYDLRLHLPSLFEEIGDWRRIRHNYYATLLELFINGWAKPYYDYCTENSLVFTGHYWEHEWPVPRVSPDNMAMYALAHMPGIDCLMNDWQTDTHAQFGNARAVKEIRSVANQLGRLRTMSETYGAGGWDLTFFDQKRIGDWEYALGVNFLNQHLSFITVKGARKRDHPLSFSYHEPWWRAYNILADYFGRLSVAMTKGEQVNRILVLEPTTTAWMYYSPQGQTEDFKALGDEFQDFINSLQADQIEYDLASEAILRGHGKIRGKKLAVGECLYDFLVLPPRFENMNEETLALLKKYLAQGGKILSLAGAPKFMNGQTTDKIETLASRHEKNWLSVSRQAAMSKMNELCPPNLVFKKASSVPGLLFHHRRTLIDAELVFLANISDRKMSSGEFETRGGSVECWDPMTGNVSPYPFEKEGDKLRVKFAIFPGGSLLLCLRRVATEKFEEPEYEMSELKPERETEIRAEDPNVLTLDYCDLRLGGKSEKDLYFYDAQRKTFEHHGLGRNPWDSAVQFKTNILDLNKFTADSGFEADYWFTVKPGVSLNSLRLVVEQPELCRIFINNSLVEALKDEWWLDKAFGVFDISKLSVPGANKITLKSSPFSIFTELEPVYLLGDFRLESQKKGFRLIPPKNLQIGPWTDQGMPFYLGGVMYEKVYLMSSPNAAQERYLIRLGNWKGSVAEVRIGEETAGFIAFPPFELDITDKCAPGENRVSVIVYGTLKNTLGPHHNNPLLGRAWPGAFQKGAAEGYPPGSEYSLVGYGLLEDFKLVVKRRR